MFILFNRYRAHRVSDSLPSARVKGEMAWAWVLSQALVSFGPQPFSRLCLGGGRGWLLGRTEV